MERSLNALHNLRVDANEVQGNKESNQSINQQMVCAIMGDELLVLYFGDVAIWPDAASALGLKRLSTETDLRCARIERDGSRVTLPSPPSKSQSSFPSTTLLQLQCSLLLQCTLLLPMEDEFVFLF
jgi:hypothetical protein